MFDSRPALAAFVITVSLFSSASAQPATIPPAVLEKAQQVGGDEDPRRAVLENALQWRFRPREGEQRVSFHETVSISGTTVQGKPMREEWERGYTHTEATRRAGSAWEITSTLTHTEGFRNGRAARNPISEALVGKTMLLSVGEDGSVISVAGVEAAIEALRLELGPESVASAGDKLSARKIEGQVEARFQDRYLDVAGRPLTEDVWIVRGRGLRSPVGGDFEGVTATRLDGFEEIDGLRCARIRVDQGCTPDDFADEDPKMAVETYFKAAGHPPKSPSGAMVGGSVYWFEVETGMMRRIRRKMSGESRRRLGARAESIHFTVEHRTDFR